LENLIIISQDRDQKVISRLTAPIAKWEIDRWFAYRCAIYQLDIKGNIIGQPSNFLRYELENKKPPIKLLEISQENKYASFKQYREKLRRFQISSEGITRRLAVDMHYNLAFPFSSVILCLIAIPFALTRTSRGFISGIGLSLAIGFTYYGVNAFSLALGKAGLLPPMFSAWLANISFLTLSLFLIKTKLS
jgi:lipopolysaccharide export system permease protein